MVDVARSRAILRLALPIIGGMLSQSLMNLVDAAFVGTLGEVPLAGVGLGGYAMFLVTAVVLGLSSGVQAQTARRHGESAGAGLAQPLQAGLLIALAVALPLSLVCVWQAPQLLGLMTPAPEVNEVAAGYFRWRVAALVPIALIVCFRGYWNGIQQAHVYLRIILITQALNVAISAGLVFGLAGLPAMGASGAGAGSAAAVYLGVLLWAAQTWRHLPGDRRGGHRRWPPRRVFATTLRLAAPHSFQQLWFAGGYAVLFWILAHIGTASVAVGHVLVNLSLLLILPGVGLGLAAMSLVGQALGRETPDDAHRWGWDVVRLAWLSLTLLALPMLLFPAEVLGLFLPGSLVEMGRVPLQLTALMIVLDAAAIVLAQALLGAGANRTVMLLTLALQWLLFLPLAWWVGVVQGYGLLGIWWAQLGYRGLNSLIFARVWQRRRWQRLAV
ncbi:MATE family efflux transporter [Modicisalibacter coralii]|uniref:MATE family efflux transporter n=1 Tax=Modicisalibacter coralii TaxID=2304602 RepID=UPI00100A457B|nr:MATE family efflux transporter [Halomonas coralii]